MKLFGIEISEEDLRECIVNSQYTIRNFGSDFENEICSDEVGVMQLQISESLDIPLNEAWFIALKEISDREEFAIQFQDMLK